MKKRVNVALLGYGFMGKAHSAAWRDAPRYFDLPAEPVMKVIAGRNEEGVKAAGERFGWQEHTTSWQEVVKRDDIHIVDISTPNKSHYPIAMEAAKAKKHILCE